MDVFDNPILCRNCNIKMKREDFSKNGFFFRSLVCPKCKTRIIHPTDESEYKRYLDLKKKDFEVKMRMVGNSYTVSIPKEIVNFMQTQENIFDSMVKLCFENTDRLSLNFCSGENQKNSRTIKSREIRIVRGNKPVLHSKQFYDSANPEKNQTKIYKENNLNLEEENLEDEE
jgi:ssDNA-binding Zn-finger/Zn-ribbon topoisomerase 1